SICKHAAPVCRACGGRVTSYDHLAPRLLPGRFLSFANFRGYSPGLEAGTVTIAAATGHAFDGLDPVVAAIPLSDAHRLAHPGSGFWESGKEKPRLAAGFFVSQWRFALTPALSRERERGKCGRQWGWIRNPCRPCRPCHRRPASPALP